MTVVTMRALHGLPAGTEVVLSYVPLNWDLHDRQQQTQQVGLCVLGGEGGAGWGVFGGGGQRTLRVLHGLPAGTEVVLSYVPLNWDLQDRQQQTQQVTCCHGGWCGGSGVYPWRGPRP